MCQICIVNLCEFQEKKSNFVPQHSELIINVGVNFMYTIKLLIIQNIDH